MYLVAIIIERRRRKTGTHVYGDLTYDRMAQHDHAKAWLDRIRRKNMPPLENMPSCFEIDFREKLTGEKSRRVLKDDAIPSSFSYGPEAKKPRLSSKH